MSDKIRYIHEDHLITRQNRAEKEFMAAFAAESPTLVANWWLNRILAKLNHLTNAVKKNWNEVDKELVK